MPEMATHMSTSRKILPVIPHQATVLQVPPLPWHKLQQSIGSILALSNNCSQWLAKLSYSYEHSYTASAAIRHYVQVLMCVGRSQRDTDDRANVADRVEEIVRTLGFGTSAHTQYLFNTAVYSKKYDLWTSFCVFINLFPQNLFDKFVERCTPDIPLDQLFVLLECSHVIGRSQQLQGVIVSRQSLENEELGLTGFEKAFISAWNFGDIELAKKLIERAKAFANERFGKSQNPHLLESLKRLLSFDYKFRLLNLLKTFERQPKEFSMAAHREVIPHEPTSMRLDDREQRQECERFRRYIIGAAFCEIEPTTCISIMEALYTETKSHDHSFLLFRGRLALNQINGDAISLRYALSEFLASLEDAEPEFMSLQWIASILDTYRQLHDAHEIDVFWMKLNSDQQARKEILVPYCRALVARGDTLIAQQIVNRYCELNARSMEDLDIKDLLDDLCKTLAVERSMSQNIQIINELSQRTTIKLAKHYSQIVSKEFDEYVAIVGQGKAPHEFLTNVVLEVAQELMLRKKNLQLHSSAESGDKNSRITKEDLVNDWFTSLFDKRMAEARVGLRDQKRGGESASGKNPGAIDGFITDAKNKRIAIFEAFRLFSNDTTVIFSHLNKIAGYDQEALSPVFIVAYCDFSDFVALAEGYAEAIAKQDYVGFRLISDTDSKIEVLHQPGNLWLARESRYRNDREVIFYHLLLNMRF